MAHPLYHQCLSYVNQHVTAHHVSGQSYYGVLQRTTPQGIYMAPPAGAMVSADSNDVQAHAADRKSGETVDGQSVFFAPFFFPFAVLAGLTLGFAAGAALSYPYYRPYPYYW